MGHTQKFAQDQGLGAVSHGVGMNYLTICDAVRGSDATEAAAMAHGIREVVAQQRGLFCLEYACHSPDEQRWFEARVTGFERQGARHIVVAHKTITERKQAEAALRQSEEQYRTLVNTTPHGIQENDVAGTITFSNRPHARMLGYADGELLGKAIWDVLASESEREYLRTYLSRLVREQSSPTPYVTQNQTKDGRLIEVQVDWNYKRDAQGRITGFLSLISDVTERTRLETQLRQSQKMEAIGTLAGGIAHEFNNALTAILGFADLMQHEIPQSSPVGSYLHEVLQAGYRAKDLVQQILAFSSQSDQTRESVSFSWLLQEVLTLVRASLPTTISIHHHRGQGDMLVLANPTQMHQVVMNLCANAEYAMRETGGLLEISLDPVDIDRAVDNAQCAISPGPYVRLTIRDTGSGIPPEVLPRIFDPFFTTKKVGEGTGMGLAIVHGIVASHDGGMTVESAPGVGTTFVIYLPRLLDAVPGGTIEPEAELPRGEGCILFVDDEEVLARLGQEMLQHLGYDAVVYTSSLEALEAFRAASHRFDMVITDQTMPEMAGEALVGELRRLRPDIPIILCTGYSHLVNAEKAVTLGVDAFLMKPLVTRDLAVAIQQVLDNRDPQER